MNNSNYSSGRSLNKSLNKSALGNISAFNLSNEDFLNEILEFIKPDLFHWIFIILFVIVFIAGTIGNFLVCYSVLRSTSLKSVTNYFLVNLATADFLVIIFCLPASTIFDVMQSWFLGLVMCKLVTYLQRVSVFVSVLTLMSISVERYMAICHPLRHQRNYFKTRLIICVIWIIALITPAGDFYNMVLEHDPEVPPALRPWLTACAPKDKIMERDFNMVLVVVFYLIPLAVMTYTYVMIAVCLWSSTSTRNTVSQNLQYESAREQLQARRRTAKMLIVVVITFALCYLPIYVINIVRYYDNVLNRLSHLTRLCLFWTARFLVYFNSAINPVIYNFMSVKFRKQFKTACFGCYTHFSICCRCLGRGKKGRKDSSSQMSMKSFPSRTNHFRSTYVSEARVS